MSDVLTGPHRELRNKILLHIGLIIFEAALSVVHARVGFLANDAITVDDILCFTVTPVRECAWWIAIYRM